MKAKHFTPLSIPSGPRSQLTASLNSPNKPGYQIAQSNEELEETNGGRGGDGLEC